MSEKWSEPLHLVPFISPTGEVREKNEADAKSLGTNLIEMACGMVGASGSRWTMNFFWHIHAEMSSVGRGTMGFESTMKPGALIRNWRESSATPQRLNLCGNKCRWPLQDFSTKMLTVPASPRTEDRQLTNVGVLLVRDVGMAILPVDLDVVLPCTRNASTGEDGSG